MNTMRGKIALTSQGGGPWPGGEAITFERSEIMKLGRLNRHGDFVTRYLLELTGNRTVFVEAIEQSAPEALWLRTLAKKAGMALTSRDAPIAIAWVSAEGHETKLGKCFACSKPLAGSPWTRVGVAGRARRVRMHIACFEANKRFNAELNTFEFVKA